MSFLKFIKESEELVEANKSNELEKSVVDFIVENPDVKDCDEIANGLELDEEQVEKIVLKLVVDFFTGGKSKGKEVDCDPEQLKLGLTVEKEHSDNPLIQKKIIFDHLSEAKTYYSDLTRMENVEKAEEKTGDEEVVKEESEPLTTYKKFSIGDRVKVKHEQSGYDGETIKTDDIGTIKRFAPKVRIVKGPIYDSFSYFAYIEFDREVDKIHHNNLRGGVDICELIKVKD